MNKKIDEIYLEKMCNWLKKEKGIIKINLFELADFVSEYEKYLKNKKK